MPGRGEGVVHPAGEGRPPPPPRPASPLPHRRSRGRRVTRCCRVCGRLLRTERSRAAGVGPVCRRASTGRTAARIPTPPPADHVPGQTELPLAHLQPTLWSL
ncbi:DUF6011 domain-containing protein [Streptomyces sp. 840.1]|uniref:DUF6011 domain-containing protein n=1 Tax=Streptomyces sp. 840.1 TaxID=2485152 RepID=UPI0037DA0A07